MQDTKILIVDDKPENNLALSNLIAEDGVEIISANSANEALEMLLKHEIALALLDVQMPIINGFSLARLMRSAERSKTIPIIFITASERTGADIFEGYERGAVDYLLKPLDPHIVRNKVRVFVELDRKSKALKAKTADLAQKLREVEILKAEAEAANQAKTRFLANMSHEIRTPLGAVLGFSELLKLEDQPINERQSYVVAIERNGKLLLKLIDDILDLSKIEADKIEAERNTISMTELVTDLRAVHELKANERGIAFEVESYGHLPKQIVSDPLRIKQILNNIVGNAIKFTQKGKVAITISYDSESTSGPRLLRFNVADTGCGLTSVEAARLFQPFMQADSSTKRKFGGTGLGLTIAKRLAQLLGGDVVLMQSEKNLGSSFEVSIDPGRVDNGILANGVDILKPVASNSTSVALDQQILKGTRVLVVDDAFDNRTLLSRILHHAGAEVEVAENGEEAVTKALTGNFDVIFMDIQMPVMDGYEAIHSLRMQGYSRAIIALTAHAMKSDLDKCLAAGSDRSLSKPIGRAGLIDNVVKFRKYHSPLAKSL